MELEPPVSTGWLPEFVQRSELDFMTNKIHPMGVFGNQECWHIMLEGRVWDKLEDLANR